MDREVFLSFKSFQTLCFPALTREKSNLMLLITPLFSENKKSPQSLRLWA